VNPCNFRINFDDFEVRLARLWLGKPGAYYIQQKDLYNAFRCLERLHTLLAYSSNCPEMDVHHGGWYSLCDWYLSSRRCGSFAFRSSRTTGSSRDTCVRVLHIQGDILSLDTNTFLDRRIQNSPCRTKAPPSPYRRDPDTAHANTTRRTTISSIFWPRYLETRTTSNAATSTPTATKFETRSSYPGNRTPRGDRVSSLLREEIARRIPHTSTYRGLLSPGQLLQAMHFSIHRISIRRPNLG
jgi:hypothetical protein